MIIVVRQMFAHNSQFVDAAFKWMPISTIAEDTVRAATKELHDKLTTLNKYQRRLFLFASPFFSPKYIYIKDETFD